MKKIIRILFAALVLVAASLQVHAQGTLIDQQSSVSPSLIGDYLNIQEDSPLLQSFVPELSAISFVQFEFWDIANNGTAGATVYVNLYEGSSNVHLDTLLASTVAVYMPNGFGVTAPGVTTFDFSTGISLTPGETYYLEPVVESGDNPWDIYAPGNTYSNGEMYVNGAGFSEDDLWFREGVAVPEPSTLALIGFSCLLIFMFKWRAKLPVMLFASALFIIPVLSVRANDSILQITADSAGLTPISLSTTTLTNSTFWIATIDTNNGLIILPPYPVLPTNMINLPAYLITNSTYLVDSTEGKISSSSTERLSTDEATAAAEQQSQVVGNLIEMLDSPPLPPGGGGGDNTNFPPHYNGLPATSDTTNIWLLATNDADGSSLDITLMNASGINVQLLSTTNLLTPATNWDLGQILQGANINYNNVFTPVPYTNAMTFFRVHQATSIIRVQDYVDTVEPDPANGVAGVVGNVYIGIENSQTEDLPVYFTLSGTAINGIDYSNIPGSIVVSNGLGYAMIDIDPIADGLKPNQTIIVTINEDTNYLIDPANAVATNNLTATPQVYPTTIGDNERVCPEITNDIYLQASDPRGLPLNYTIVNWPKHGTLDTNAAPICYYTPTNCYKGQDSFTFMVNDGQYSSAITTVGLDVAVTVYANAITAQTCRGTTVPVTLAGGDNGCGIATNYAILTNPSYGTLSGTPPNITYTPSGTSFTGTDVFNYVVFDNCGDAATNSVAVTVGDANISPSAQDVTTGTNDPITVALAAVDNDSCTADGNYYVYNITGPTNGTLTHISGNNFKYTPNHNYEGMDSFQFTVSDGGLTSAPVSINLYVVAGPILSTECDPFGTAIQLNWTLDTETTAMTFHGLSIYDYTLYRSTNSSGPFTAIYSDTNSVTSDSYIDTNVLVNQTYYYEVNFHAIDFNDFTIYVAPLSNKIEASSQNPDNLISANSFWEVVTNLAHPNIITNLQAPFSSTTNQYPGLYPLPNSIWTTDATWSNSTTMFIPTNTPMSEVQYSIAIDNSYTLYVNGSLVGTGDNNNADAVWSPFQPFPDNILHYGTNSVNVLIQDEGDINYFSMVVTTNTCDH